MFFTSFRTRIKVDFYLFSCGTRKYITTLTSSVVIVMTVYMYPKPILWKFRPTIGPRYIIIEVTNEVKSLSSNHLVTRNLVRFLRSMI